MHTLNYNFHDEIFRLISSIDPSTLTSQTIFKLLKYKSAEILESTQGANLFRLPAPSQERSLLFNIKFQKYHANPFLRLINSRNYTINIKLSLPLFRNPFSASLV